jgi:hypothetical protein
VFLSFHFGLTLWHILGPQLKQTQKKRSFGVYFFEFTFSTIPCSKEREKQERKERKKKPSSTQTILSSKQRRKLTSKSVSVRVVEGRRIVECGPGPELDVVAATRADGLRSLELIGVEARAVVAEHECSLGFNLGGHRFLW